MKCVYCDKPATHYVNVIYGLDERWADAGTNYGDNYTCQQHLSQYIDTFDVAGSEVIEVTAKTLTQVYTESRLECSS